MMAWRIAKIILLLALVTGGGYAFWRYGRGQKSEEKTAMGSVERGDLEIKVTVTGIIQPRSHALITAPYNGYVQKLYVKVGDQVKQGDPIVSVAQTIGNVQEEVFPLLSPLSGVVVQVLHKESEYVGTGSSSGSQGNTLVRIDDVSKLFLDASVPEVEIGKVKMGLPVLIRALAFPQAVYHGKIIEIAQAAKEQDRWGDRARVEFPVTAQLLDQDDKLKPGMSAVIDVIVRQQKGVLKLRHEYVQKAGEEYFVIKRDGQHKTITVGLENEVAFEITGGITEGEEVQQIDFLELAKNRGS